VYNAEEQCSVAQFLVDKMTQCNVFAVYGEKCLCIKRFTTESRNSLKDVRRSHMLTNQLALVRKSLRQQSKDLYVAGFNTLLKRSDKCTNVGGGYVEK
jgi:hypothetical protein